MVSEDGIKRIYGGTGKEKFIYPLLNNNEVRFYISQHHHAVSHLFRHIFSCRSVVLLESWRYLSIPSSKRGKPSGELISLAEAFDSIFNDLGRVQHYFKCEFGLSKIELILPNCHLMRELGAEDDIFDRITGRVLTVVENAQNGSIDKI